MEKKYIVGIDFGEKRVGIASTDPLQIIANAINRAEADTLCLAASEYTQVGLGYSNLGT